MIRPKLVVGAVALAIFLDTLIYGIVIPILPGYSESLGASSFVLGVIFAAYSASLLVGTIPLGILSDRYGRKRVMFFGLVALSLSTLGFALAKSIVWLIITRLLQGFAAGATWTACPALIADLYPPEQRGSKMGLMSAASGFGFLVGPAAGGLLYEAGGYHLPFLICIILAILAVIFVAVVIPGDSNPVKMPKSSRPLLKVLRIRGVWQGSTMVLIGSVGFGFIDPLLPGYFADKFAASPGVIGLLFGVISLFHVSSAPVIGKLSDHMGRVRLIKIGLVTTALVVPLITLAANAVTSAITMGLMGITFGLMLTPTMPLLADSVMPRRGSSDDSSYGVAFGIYNGAFSLGYLIGPLIGGAWVEFYDLPSLFVAYSIVLLLTGLVTFRHKPYEHKHAT